MRRLFVVGVLLAMMLGLRLLQGDGDGISDPLTLATIGFVVLAAFALAELGGALSLPKVTGYILTGIALGPSATDIMSAEVVEQMRMFNTLALGLIAIAAGLELDLGALRKLSRTLAATIAVKIVTGVVLVGGVVYLLEIQLDSLGLVDNAERLGVAIVFAALSLGTSPSIALAVITETAAKGRLTDLVLGAAVVKDLVVVVAVAVAVAVTHSLTGGGAFGFTALRAVGTELGASIVAGVVVGAVLIAYLRWINAEMLLFVAALILLVAEASAALHLELLLVCIVAGLIVRNFSRYEHDLMPPLQMISLPVFIVFFTNAGASVDLRASITVLPLAAAVAVMRAIGYRAASEIGGRVGKESREVRRVAWLGYLPQAGVTLGILGMAAGELGGHLGDAVSTLGMAVVALHLLVGPVTLRIALHRTGEIPAAETASDHPSSSMTAAVSGDDPQLEDPVLAAIVDDLRTTTRRTIETWIDDVATPHLQGFSTGCCEAVARLGEAARVRRSITDLGVALRELPAATGGALSESLLEVVRGLPESKSVALERRHREVQPGDRRGLRWRKRRNNALAAIMLRSDSRVRSVPVRRVARTRLELGFVELATLAQNEVMRSEASMIAILEACVHGSATTAEAIRDLQIRAERDFTRLRGLLVDWLDASMRDVTIALHDVDTPALPVRRVRYSSVEKAVRDRVHRLTQDAAVWPSRVDAALETVIVGSATVSAGLETRAAFEERIVVPLERATLALSDAARAIETRVARVEAAVVADDPAALRIAVAALPGGESKELRAALAGAEAIPEPARVVEPLLPDVPERARVYPTLTELARAARPTTVEPVDSPLRERIEALVHTALIDATTSYIDDMAARLGECDRSLVDGVGVVELLARPLLEPAASDADARRTLLDAIARERARLGPIASDAVDRATQLRTAVETAFDRSYGLLSERVIVGAGERNQDSRIESNRLHPPQISAMGRWWRRLRLVVLGEAARYVERQRRRAEQADHDPADMREVLVARLRARDDLRAPKMYERLFADAPLRDGVLFVAHRIQLDAFVTAGRAWRADRLAGNAALVVGGSGAGKTSLLHVTQRQLGLRRVVSVSGRREAGRATLFEALGAELGCASDVTAIAARLARGPTIVLLDDLHTWVDASVGGIERLTALLELIADTGAHAFWVVAMHRDAFALIDETIPLRGWFSQVEHLRPIDGDMLAEIVDTRHRPTDLRLEFPDLAVGRALAGLRRSGTAQRYHHELARQTRGNLRAAIRLWRAHAVLRGETVHMRELDGDAVGLPFGPSLDVDALAALLVLLREGPRRPAELDHALATASRRTIRLLTTASLAERVGDSIDLFAAFRDDIEMGLVAAGVSRKPGAP